MYTVKNFLDNDDIIVTQNMGPFAVAEYSRDLSVGFDDAQTKYFMAQMGVRRKQLACDLSEASDGVKLQAGAMQWMLGDVKQTSGVKGVGDLIGKVVRGKVTGETAVKPEYSGIGMVVCEPTYKHLILMDLGDWGGSAVLDDGLFLACEGSMMLATAVRSSVSSAIAGGEGLFNLCLKGSGYFCLESDCPKEELITIDMRDDTLKIDGNYALAWSSTLKFTVERSGATLVGSAASGEGLVNVYRGTGRVLLQPVR